MVWVVFQTSEYPGKTDSTYLRIRISKHENTTYTSTVGLSSDIILALFFWLLKLSIYSSIGKTIQISYPGGALTLAVVQLMKHYIKNKLIRLQVSNSQWQSVNQVCTS